MLETSTLAVAPKLAQVIQHNARLVVEQTGLAWGPAVDLTTELFAAQCRYVLDRLDDTECVT